MGFTSVFDDNRSNISQLKNYIKKNNPDLDSKVSNMLLHDAVCEICDVYGVDRPHAYEAIKESANNILVKIKETVEGNKNG